MRVFVTGARGYLGRCLVPVLRKSGCEVVENTCRLGELPARSIGADVVIHAAAVVRGTRHYTDCLAKNAGVVHEVNATGTRRVLEALCGAPRFLYLSSKSVYGVYDPPRLVDEDTPPAPTDPYSASKLGGEREVLASGLEAVVVRPSSFYGVAEDCVGTAFVNRWIEAVIAGRPVPVFGDGSQRVDLVYVWDLARVLATLALMPHVVPGVYNCCGRHISVAGLARELVAAAAELGLEATAVSTSDPVPPGTLLDDRRLRSFLPQWMPTPHRQVLRELLVLAKTASCTPQP